MDKMQMAHEMALAMANDGNVPNENIIAIVWAYADAMQAEAENRKPSGLPDALKKEWQPDWSQAPEWAKWWAMDKDGDSYYFEEKPEMKLAMWVQTTVSRICFTHSSYQGDWKDSLRERPE